MIVEVTIIVVALFVFIGVVIKTVFDYKQKKETAQKELELARIRSQEELGKKALANDVLKVKIFEIHASVQDALDLDARREFNRRDYEDQEEPEKFFELGLEYAKRQSISIVTTTGRGY